MNSPIRSEPLASFPFEFLAGTFVVVKPSIGQAGPRRFILDTGAGIDAISSRLAEKLGCVSTGTLTGKRMRGDAITLDLTNVETLKFGGIKRTQWEVGITSLFNDIPKELGELDGVLSLKFFADQPFTIDFPRKTIFLESEESLERRVIDGSQVEVTPYSQLPKSLGIFLKVNAFGEVGSYEVDTGNMITIMPPQHLERLRVDLNSTDTKVSKGARANRVMAGIKGKITLADAPAIFQLDPQISFEEIIYDGVIGIDFLKDKVVTFDILKSRMIFSKI